MEAPERDYRRFTTRHSFLRKLQFLAKRLQHLSEASTQYFRPMLLHLQLFHVLSASAHFRFSWLIGAVTKLATSSAPGQHTQFGLLTASLRLCIYKTRGVRKHHIIFTDACRRAQPNFSEYWHMTLLRTITCKAPVNKLELMEDLHLPGSNDWRPKRPLIPLVSKSHNANAFGKCTLQQDARRM